MHFQYLNGRQSMNPHLLSSPQEAARGFLEDGWRRAGYVRVAPLASFGDMGPHEPERLRLEGSNALVALHTESECGCLAGPVAHHCRVQVSVLALPPQLADISPVSEHDLPSSTSGTIT